MEEQEDKLGSLFKTSFEGHKVPLEEGEWDVLSNRLEKRNFFKFNPYQFNIYYASTIIACFFICLGLGSNYVYKQYVYSEPLLEASGTKVNTTVPTVEAPKSRNVTVNPKGLAYDTQATVIPQKEEKAIKKGDAVETAVEMPQHHLISSPIKKDTIAHLEPQQPTLQVITTDSSKINKKVLYITKQDTIFKYDTVRTHKSKKRWLK